MPTICQYLVGNRMLLVVISISIYTSTSVVTTVIVPCWNPKDPLPGKGAHRDAAGCFGWEDFIRGLGEIESHLPTYMNRMQEWGGEEHRIAIGPQSCRWNAGP